MYLQDNELLDSFQSAYKPGHSVETLLDNLLDIVFRELDSGNITALIMLDMSSAFDTVDHAILIQRLRYLGIKGTVLDWFISYLCDRSHYVRIGDSTSCKTMTKFGVPQGSVGGPLLFSLYMQPISEVFRKHCISYHCYADDIQLYLSFKPTVSSLSSAIAKLEACLQDLKIWLTSNGLKLNDDKSEFLLLGSKHMLSKVDYQSCHVNIGSTCITPSKTARNLGVIFDQEMSFRSHVTHIQRNVRYQLRNLSFIRKYLSKSAAEILIHALISSRLDFSNSLLCNLSKKDVTKLQRLQNSAARLLTFTNKFDSMSPVLRSLHWLPVEKRIIFKILLLVHHSVHSFSPIYISNSVQKYNPTRRLRSSSDTFLLQTPRVKHGYGDHAFSVMGPKLWNKLPLQLRELSSTESFKSKLKTYLFLSY